VRFPLARPRDDLKLVLTGLLVSIAPPALAAPPRPGVAQVPRQTIDAFARCVTMRHHGEAADYVLGTTPSWTPAGVRARRKLADAGCISAETSREDARTLLSADSEGQLRPVLAEALVRSDLPVFDARLINTAQPLDYGKLVDALWPAGACKGCKPAVAKEIDEIRTRSSAALAPLIFGECVARSDPANVHKMLLSQPGSPQEAAAMDALRPVLADCVVQGVQFTIGSTDLRQSLALIYYRLSHAPRVHSQR
jgi:hypothetical protein